MPIREANAILQLRGLEPAGSNRCGMRQSDCTSARPARAPSVLIVIGSKRKQNALYIGADEAYGADPPDAFEVNRMGNDSRVQDIGDASSATTPT